MLNVARCCEVFVFELLRLSPTSIGLSSSLYSGVVENQSKHLKSPCLLYFITPQLMRECVPFSESRTKPKQGSTVQSQQQALFISAKLHWWCSTLGIFFLFKLKTNEFLQVTYILNRLISVEKLEVEPWFSRCTLSYKSGHFYGFKICLWASALIWVFSYSRYLYLYFIFFPWSLDFCLIHGF